MNIESLYHDPLNKEILSVMMSEDPSNLYDGATSYQSKKSNLNDNYGLSKKLGTSYQDYLDFIKGKKKSHDSIAKLDSFNLSEANAGVDMDESLSQDSVAKEFVEMTNAAKAKEIVKLYYNQYISKLSSDLQWRLGNYIDPIEDIEIDENILVDGKYPSRGFVIPTNNTSYYNGLQYMINDDNYVSYGFPPFKLDIDKNIIDDTQLMTTAERDPESTFDLDKFSIGREEFAYREMGMKTLSGFIDYLQYLTEGVTGIVSTYMTEWDLSTYMQENLMSVADNKIDLTLNYRIRQDNPFSDRYEYRGDKALSFNVCGSSVSKLYGDNEKLWLPSDYVYSSWWTPYLENVDFTVKTLELESMGGVSVRYMDCYDNFDLTYDYDSQNNLINIIKHQDTLQTMASCKTSFTFRYYDAFYSSADDSLSGYDIMLDKYLKECAGTVKCRTMATFLNECKLEMLSSGGYENALYSAAFANGGLFGKQAVKRSLEKSGEMSKTELLDEKAQQSSSDITISGGIVDDLSNSKNNNGAFLAKMDGISRFSPVIYGGNHGACYSLNSIRGQLENTTLNLNIPTVNMYSAKTNFEDMEYKYRNTSAIQICRSPTKNKNTLFKGDINYTYVYGNRLVKYTKEFEASVDRNIFTGEYTFKFPKRCKGAKIEYSSNIYTKSKTILVKSSMEEIRAAMAPALQELAEIGSETATEFKNGLEKAILTVLGEGRIDYSTIFNKKTTKKIDISVPSQKYVTIDVPCCMGTYYLRKPTLTKIPIVNDAPDMEWTIHIHEFDEYKASSSMSGSFIKNAFLATRSKFYGNKQAKEAMKENPGFILRFPSDPIKEQDFINKMLWYGKGKSNNNPIYLYFLEGNKKNRYTEGPESIFKAPCYVRYYNAIPKKESIFKRFIRWITNDYSPQKTNVPYIYVDLYNTVEFYDGLNRNLNFCPNSGYSPLHTNSECNFARAGSEYTNPIQKLHKIGTDILVSQQGKVSRSLVGLEGTGILTGLLGLDKQGVKVLTVKENIEVEENGNGLNVDYDKDTPLKNLPYYTASIKEPKSFYVEKKNYTKNYMTQLLASQEYERKPYDPGLRNAYLNMITRLTMFKYGDELSIPYFLDMSAPYRNIISVLISHKNYLNTTKNLLNSMGADYIHDLLVNNVDRSVLFACGMIFDENGYYTISTPSKTHLLYNYWIDKAVHTFGSLASARNYLSSVISLVDEQSALVDKFSEDLKKILDVNSKLWTLNDIDALNNCLVSIKNTFYKRNILDDFLMTYLNILYHYRLFYIGNRFNKVDGTMWRMRHFEAALNLMKEPNIVLPKSPSDFEVKPEKYNVAFIEVQNTTAKKVDSVANGTILDKDRVYRLYVKVQYTTKEAFEKWCAYRDNPDVNERVPEVNRYKIDGEYRYILKPADGVYQFRSKEYNANQKNIKWNKKHPASLARNVWKEDIDCKFNITWHNSADKTPIRWNVLGNINTDKLLEYAPMGITGVDLVCLIEEGSDFWTINIPEGLWPEKSHYQSNLYIKQIFEDEFDDIKKDAYVTILGPLAHSVSPIIEEPMDISLNFTNRLQ